MPSIAEPFRPVPSWLARPSSLARASVLVMGCAGAPLSAQSWLPPSPFPAWGAAPPANVTTLHYDPALSQTGNGQRLYNAIQQLQAGRGLAVGPGTWSVPHRLDLHGVGSASAPIWLFAANPQQKPVITRPDNGQNAINVGSNGPARYWVLRDLEIRGGSDLLRIYDCAHLWVDRCYLHDGDGVGIAAHVFHNDHLWITRNEIARPGSGNGEAIYLGGNHGSTIVSWSVIALNHVHDTRAAVPGQGDGIELKQGSHHNWIVGNRVHDTKNPCILVYGTYGNGQNVVEANVLYDSDEVVLQVQGDAVVRNNIAIGGSVAFSSHDHQGQSQHLQVVHNTFVNDGPAVSLHRWNGRPAMVFANNAAYSTTAEAVYFGNGMAGVQLAGNVAFGGFVNGGGSGFAAGSGLADFVNVHPSGSAIDVRPVVAGPLDNRASLAHAVWHDAYGTPRSLPLDAGAVTNARSLSASAGGVSVATGGSVQLHFDAQRMAGKDYHVYGSISGTLPGTPLGPFTLPLNHDAFFVATANGANIGVFQQTRGVVAADGRATATLHTPPLSPSLQGLAFDYVLVASENQVVRFVSNPVRLVLQ